MRITHALRTATVKFFVAAGAVSHAHAYAVHNLATALTRRILSGRASRRLSAGTVALWDHFCVVFHDSPFSQGI